MKKIENFMKSIYEAPDTVCASCGGLWFQKSTNEITYNKLSEEIKQQWEDFELDSSDDVTVCITCKRNLMSNKISKLSLINGLG